MMTIDGIWVIYRQNAAPNNYFAQLYTVAPAGLTAQALVLLPNTDLEALRSRLPPGTHRVVVTGPTVPAGHTLVEAWV